MASGVREKSQTSQDRADRAARAARAEPTAGPASLGLGAALPFGKQSRKAGSSGQLFGHIPGDQRANRQPSLFQYGLCFAPTKSSFCSHSHMPHLPTWRPGTRMPSVYRNLTLQCPAGSKPWLPAQGCGPSLSPSRTKPRGDVLPLLLAKSPP